MGFKNKIDNFFSSLVENKLSYQLYFDKIKEMKMSRFEYDGMPEEIDIRFMELNLFERGGVVFFRDDVADKYICLPYTDKSRWNIYNVPILRRAFASNGYNVDLDINNSVIIWNNSLRTPEIRDTEIYARRLALFDRTIDVNVHAQKTPVLIRCDEHERLTLQNLYMKYDGGQPVIYGDKNLASQPLSAISTEAPFVADKIYDLKTKFWNEMLTFAGISNVTYQKKERLISDEVNRSQGGTIAARYSGLDARKQALDEINRMFGLNISVRYREADSLNNDDYKMDPEDMAADPEGGEPNE